MNTQIESEQGLVTVMVHESGSATVTMIGIPAGPAAPGGSAVISADPGNRATQGSDGGVFVRDDLVPDPLAYYILAKS